MKYLKTYNKILESSLETIKDRQKKLNEHGIDTSKIKVGDKIFLDLDYDVNYNNTWVTISNINDNKNILPDEIYYKVLNDEMLLNLYEVKLHISKEDWVEDMEELGLLESTMFSPIYNEIFNIKVGDKIKLQLSDRIKRYDSYKYTNNKWATIVTLSVTEIYVNINNKYFLIDTYHIKDFEHISKEDWPGEDMEELGLLESTNYNKISTQDINKTHEGDFIKDYKNSKNIYFIAQVDEDEIGKLIRVIHISVNKDKYEIFNTFIISNAIRNIYMIDGEKYLENKPDLYKQLVDYNEFYSKDLLKSDKFKNVIELVDTIDISKELGLLESNVNHIKFKNVNVGDKVKIDKDLLVDKYKQYMDKWLTISKVIKGYKNDKNRTLINLLELDSKTFNIFWIVNHMPKEEWPGDDMDELGLLESNKHGINLDNIKKGDKLKLSINKRNYTHTAYNIVHNKWVTFENFIKDTWMAKSSKTFTVSEDDGHFYELDNITHYVPEEDWSNEYEELGLL